MRDMPRGRADIATTALRIFLQEMGTAYDTERGFAPYDGKRDFQTVRTFFGDRCCYCGAQLTTGQIAQDHLVPMNKTNLGLHAWGNSVPACSPCNASKQGKEWHAYLVTRAGEHAAERYQRVTAFVQEYKYAPDPSDLRDVAEELYAEVGSIAMTLITERSSDVAASFDRSLQQIDRGSVLARRDHDRPPARARRPRGSGFCVRVRAVERYD